MKLRGLAIGLALFLAAFLIGRWNLRRAAGRREAERRAERASLGHITGGGRAWWKEPPGDGPQGDH
jgi:hypothetical protein